jgi:hypothetical protein
MRLLKCEVLEIKVGCGEVVSEVPPNPEVPGAVEVKVMFGCKDRPKEPRCWMKIAHSSVTASLTNLCGPLLDPSNAYTRDYTYKVAPDCLVLEPDPPWTSGTCSPRPAPLLNTWLA